MWANLTIFLSGIIIGMTLMWFLTKNEIGDDYKINKPKVKGENNSMKISQENSSPNKISGFFNKKDKKFMSFLRKRKKIK
jgi:hypothetical protein